MRVVSHAHYRWELSHSTNTSSTMSMCWYVSSKERTAGDIPKMLTAILRTIKIAPACTHTFIISLPSAIRVVQFEWCDNRFDYSRISFASAKELRAVLLPSEDRSDRDEQDEDWGYSSMPL
jgi:hypothetical protein